MAVVHWFQNAIFYEVYVRAFKDSNADGKGDLPGLVSKLDYLKELGVDCIWVMPIYPSPLKDDGYDISDYYHIHPDYGTVEDFRGLVQQAHARGIRVISDMVMNHVSDQHPWFRSAIAGRNSPYRDYFVWSDTDQRYRDARIIFLDTEPSNWTREPNGDQFYWHRFYSSQPDLNYDNPAVQEEMLRVLRFWLEMGIDGFRVDAVPYLFEREGTNCENLPETHAFLKKVRAMMDEEYQDRILLCEANQWPQDVRDYFGNGDECQMAFQFPIMPRIFLGLARGSSVEIRSMLARTSKIPDNCQWCTFLRNHDELTLEMVTEEERQFMWDYYAPQKRMRSNLGIRRRLAALLENDRRRMELANSLLFTIPGAPIIYYGDEIGMGDNIHLHDRNGLRTPMQWINTEDAGFTTAAHPFSPVIKADGFEPACVNVADQQANPDSFWQVMRRMIAIRKEHPVLASQHIRWEEDGNDHTAVYLRADGREKILAAQNMSADEQTARLPVDVRIGDFKLLMSGGDVRVDATANTIVLAPYAYGWFVVV